MQLQGRAVGVPEKYHRFVGVVVSVQEHGVALDAPARQPLDGLRNAVHPEAQMPQAAGLGVGDPLWRIGHDEQLNAGILVDLQVDHPVIPVGPLNVVDHLEAQLIHIKIVASFIVGTDDGNVMDGVEFHDFPPVIS